MGTAVVAWDGAAQPHPSPAPFDFFSAGSSGRGQGVPDALTADHVWGEWGCHRDASTSPANIGVTRLPQDHGGVEEGSCPVPPVPSQGFR